MVIPYARELILTDFFLNLQVPGKESAKACLEACTFRIRNYAMAVQAPSWAVEFHWRRELHFHCFVTNKTTSVSRYSETVHAVVELFMNASTSLQSGIFQNFFTVKTTSME